MTGQALPLVSVVMPSYNHAHLISRAIASVLAQSYDNFELIVVDNHSLDNTDEVIAGFQDERIRLLKIHNNGVIAASRNMGLRAARGEWIAFLDSDDWWTADKLVRCARWFDRCDFVYHRLEIMGDKPTRFFPRHIKSWQLGTPAIVHLLVVGNPIATSSVVVRTSLMESIGGFDERKEIVAAEDYNTWLRIAQLTEKFKFLPATLGYYLFSPHSASRKDMSIPMRNVCSAFSGVLDARQRLKMEANSAYAAGRHAYVHRNFALARQELEKSLRWGRRDIRWKSLLNLVWIWMEKIRRSGACKV